VQTKRIDDRYLKRRVTDISAFCYYKGFLDRNFPRLKAGERTVILARFCFRLPVRKICRMFGISSKTVFAIIRNFQSYDCQVRPVTPQEAEWKRGEDRG